MNPPSEQASKPPRAPGAGATLDQWLNWLESIHPADIDLGLDRVLLVLRRLFPGKPDARVITVAGTNGKGSTVATLETLLLASGRRAGAYTSPHLQAYNERVRIDGQAVDDDTLIAAFEKVEAARGSVTLTYFEFGTLAAFVVLANAGVQDWILEVGLGGRLDAVNVIDPDLAIITSVDIDHVGFLGDDREVIGFEKAGILRPGITAIVADENPPRSVLQQASAQNVTLYRANRDYLVHEAATGHSSHHTDTSETGANTRSGASLHWQEQSVNLPHGQLPVQSVAAAVMAMRLLEPDAALPLIEKALASVALPGRFERLGQSPDVYVDVGHNPHAAKWLCTRLLTLKTPGRKVHAVYAALADKDVCGVAGAMAGVVDRWFLAGLEVPRGLSAPSLEKKLSAFAGNSLSVHHTVAGAVAQAKSAAAPDDIIIIFGSFFTVAEARALLI